MPLSKHSLDVYNNTFSGTDMVATIVFPGVAPITIGELATVSYSVYREKNPVRTLSRISVKGFTKGSRTVAGTLIFTVFDKHIVNKLRAQVPYLNNLVRIKTDELPTFDIYITMGNEYGASARLNIYGITIVDEGKVMSIEDLFTENQWSYMARDIDLMDDLGAEQNKPLEEFRTADETTGAFKTDALVMDNTFEQMQKDLKAYKDAQKAKVAAERAAEMKKYTYTVPDLSYKAALDVVADGGKGDDIWNLSPEERAHLYDKNKPQLTVDERHESDGDFDDAHDNDSSVRSLIVHVRADKEGDDGASFLSGVTIGVSITFFDDNGNEVTDKVGQGSTDGDLSVILDLHHYHEWTPTKPKINLYVAEGHRSLQNADGATFNLIGDGTYTVTGENEGRPDDSGGKMIMFTWAEAGSQSEQTGNNANGISIELEGEGFGQVLAGDSHTVKIYRDGYISGTPNGDGTYNTITWLTPGFLTANQSTFNPFNIKSYNGCKVEKVNPGFKIWISGLTKDGSYFSFDDAKDYLNRIQISCDIEIGADVGSGQIVIASGSDANANAFSDLTDDAFDDSFKFMCNGLKNGNYDEFYIYDDTPVIGGSSWNIFGRMAGGSFRVVTLHGKSTNDQLNESNLTATFKNWKGTYIPLDPKEYPIEVSVSGPSLHVIVDVMTEDSLSEIK